MKPTVSPLLMIACLCGLNSCSLKFTRPDGSVTYLGLVNIREGRAGDLPLVHSRRLGVMVDAGAANNGVAIGYDNRLIVLPPDNATTGIDYVEGHDPQVSISKARD